MQNQQNPMAALEAKQQNQPAAVHVNDETVETPALKEFNKLLDRSTAIEFNPKWANGTGYFDGAVNGPDAPQLDYKKIYSFSDHHGRKGLIFPTRHGNVVVFNRYSNRREVIGMNAPRTIGIFFNEGRPLTHDDLIVIGGGWGVSTIGMKIESAIAYEERRKKYEVSGDVSDHPDTDSWKEVQG